MRTSPDKNQQSLPEIPNKRYFTISEVSDLCDVKPHVLRYWEQEFPDLKPVKRRGNRRYYQRHDVVLIRQIRSLLYQEGYTIGGARQHLASDEMRENKAQTLQFIRQLITEQEELLRVLRDTGSTDSTSAPPSSRAKEDKEFSILVEGIRENIQAVKNHLGQSNHGFESLDNLQNTTLQIPEKRKIKISKFATVFVGLGMIFFPVCYFLLLFVNGTLLVSPVLIIMLLAGVVAMRISAYGV